MNIIVVGIGAIGKERIKVLQELNETIIAIIDITDSLTDDLVQSADWIFVCTPHDTTVEIVRLIRLYMNNKKVNILVEKPFMGHNQEILRVNNVGFNYRFLKGVRHLLDDVKNEVFGELISVDMILGLGDSEGSENTWRLDPLRAGRGAILDPGIHLIDLAMIMSNGNLDLKYSSHWQGFWRTGIEEETHIIARDYRWVNDIKRNDRNSIYNIRASKVHWRPTFRIEVNGTDGCGIVEGRNRFYGNQTYRRGKRWGWGLDKTQRESEELLVDYNGNDSFLEETRAILYGCKGLQPATNEDNKRCLKFIEGI